MKSINQLVQEAHSNAISKGWWEEPRTYGELIALVHSEVSEALEDYRAGCSPYATWYEKKCGDEIKRSDEFVNDTWKPCGIPSELADVCIRIFDIAGKCGWGKQLEGEIHHLSGLETNEKWNGVPFAGKLSNIHYMLSKSLEAHDFTDDITEAVLQLGAAVVGAELIAQEYGIDLERAIYEKMAYNATRPQRHGGKVL